MASAVASWRDGIFSRLLIFVSLLSRPVGLTWCLCSELTTLPTRDQNRSSRTSSTDLSLPIQSKRIRNRPKQSSVYARNRSYRMRERFSVTETPEMMTADWPEPARASLVSLNSCAPDRSRPGIPACHDHRSVRSGGTVGPPAFGNGQHRTLRVMDCLLAKTPSGSGNNGDGNRVAGLSCCVGSMLLRRIQWYDFRLTRDGDDLHVSMDCSPRCQPRRRLVGAIVTMKSVGSPSVGQCDQSTSAACVEEHR